MSVEALMRRSATLVLREPGEPDEYGDPVATESEVETRCELQQAGAREELGGNVQATTWRIFLPADAPARGWDAVEVDGVRYELTGDAWLVRNARTGELHHVEAYVSEVA